MHIVADENIPYVRQAFESLGEVDLMPGRQIGAVHVRNADILLVRSVTLVTAELLNGSQVRFVGSATIGVDHVDVAYLKDRRIEFAYAPGSNANAVAEYVIAALLALRGPVLKRPLGLIGLGRIGTLVKAKAEALGMPVLANDPPLSRVGRSGLVSLPELLNESGVVSCHVPLIKEGPDCTNHLLDRQKLSRLAAGAVVINTSRGAVVDNAALLAVLSEGCLAGAVLDVWESEPCPDPALITKVTLGTPHIAGYSVDGKVKGTQMLYEALCTFLQQPPQWRSSPLPRAAIDLAPLDNRRIDQLVGDVVCKSYDIRQDDAQFRMIAGLPNDKRGEAFDTLRATYPSRFEFANTAVTVPSGYSDIGEMLSGVGFRVHTTPADKSSS
jgi:erythronate-4-phosphate dehydrogenase